MKAHLIDNETYFQQLKKTPFIAWPTVLLLVAIYVTITSAWYLVINEIIPIWLGCLMNIIAYYYIFSVAHDGLHRAISSNHKLNDFIARVGFFPASLLTSAYPYFRMFHMQHHINCGEEGLDPDIEISSKGRNALSLWFIWGSQYKAYFKEYKNSLPPVNVKNRKLLDGTSLLILIVMWISFPFEMLLLWLVPSLMVAWATAFVFSYLPHHIHKRVPGQDELDKYQSTCNRIGWEWLMNPLTQYQNYHLVHHLYPTVPFYRYEKIWKARKSFHESNKPAEVHQFSNKPTYY